MNRCSWSLEHPLLTEYHDTEWGVPLHDEIKHFEFLVLESMQAGLAWLTVLKKREAFREAFEGFDPEKVAGFTQSKIELLLKNPGIIRNKRKILSAVNNAKRFLETSTEFGTFDSYIWSFTDGKIINNNRHSENDIPANSELSERISKDLKARGYTFIGTTIIYAHLQAIGIINDHIISCFRKRTASFP